jgi:hypothetical protein
VNQKKRRKKSMCEKYGPKQKGEALFNNQKNKINFFGLYL